MTEKKPKSPVLVISAIIFLAIFIILPPVFRSLIPRQDVSSVEETKETFILSCEKNSLAEGYKIMSKLIYENDLPTKNTISYTKNTATEGVTGEETESLQGQTDDGTVQDSESLEVVQTRTVAEEIEFFKAIDGIKVNESDTYTSVIITSDVVDSNSNNLELINYFLSETEQTTYFEQRGFTCSGIEI